jgi:DNA-binding response OmpR family regulator
MHFRWGDCELDREARVLSRAGRPFRAQPLVVDLLLLLLENRERVVSDAVLRRKLWPGYRSPTHRSVD